MSNQTREFPVRFVLPGIPMLILGVLLLLSCIVWIALAVNRVPPGDVWGLMIIPSILGSLLILRGLILINPNQAKVVTLFGRYVGSVRDAGFFWINPFTVRRKLSRRVHNFNSDTLKVNDLRGNPVEIGAVVVWRVEDTAQAAFDVEDYQSYVAVQSEAALRTLAAKHPYDSPAPGEVSLRGSTDEVSDELRHELTERLALAGVHVLEVRLSHLAYAPEIAGAMLRRQQAEAIIDARARIVDGAVGMVEMALDHLKQRQVIELDEERKAAMVNNLLVVLCSDRDATPVLNAGTLYS
jgi:regulator of protease activity HflC (stomatin/prohibitin superfamily)